MDTRTLVAFKTVCDAGSIGHAAEQLFISPQGLSKSMARLEAELGSALLVRTNRGVEPTRAGRLLYERADQIAGILDSLRQSIAADPPETLRVAASSGHLVRFGAEFRQAFEARNPGYRLAVEEYNDSGVLQALRDWDADCGFASGPSTSARSTDGCSAGTALCSWWPPTTRWPSVVRWATTTWPASIWWPWARGTPPSTPSRGVSPPKTYARRPSPPSSRSAPASTSPAAARAPA